MYPKQQVIGNFIMIHNKTKKHPQSKSNMIIFSFIGVSLVVVLIVARAFYVDVPDVWADVEPFIGLEHGNCDTPCVLGITIGQTTLEQAEQLLIEQDIRHEVRPTHIGGAGVYARYYDWDNPVQIRIYDFVFSHNEIRFEENVADTIFLSGGVICPINFFAMYDDPVSVGVDEHGGFSARYPHLGMGYRYQKSTNSAQIWLWKPNPVSLETEKTVTWRSALIELVEQQSASC